jgi:Flp pilus assembly pilin Flp
MVFLGQYVCQCFIWFASKSDISTEIEQVTLIRKFRPKESGQGVIEYGLLLTLLVVILILILRLLGVNLSKVYCQVVSGLMGKNVCTATAYCADTFDNFNNWSNTSGWQIKNGQVCNTSNGFYLFNKCSQANTFPSDYQVNIDFAMLYQGSGYGVWFRQTSTNPLNGYIFQYDPGLNAYVFRKWINGAETAPFASKTLPPGYSWYNVTRKIKIVVAGNVYKAYVDDQLVLTATDSTYPKGGIGLRTWDSTMVCFDNLSITTP